MTPLLEECVHRLGNWAWDWDAEQIGITSPQGMLAAISAAKVYVIDEAETDTTTARDLHPGYFATTSGFYLPARVCWFEYKAYAPVQGSSVWTGFRSAFLAMADETGGIVVFLVSQIPFFAPGVVFMPGFGFEPDIERRPDVMEGRPFVLRTSASPSMDPAKLSECANFFMETVELVNMPAGVIHREQAPDRTFRRRLAKAMGRVDFDLQPVTHITLDLPDLMNRTTRGAA